MRYQRKRPRAPGFNLRATRRLYWLAAILGRARIQGPTGLEFDPRAELPELARQLRAIASGRNAQVEFGLRPGSGRRRREDEAFETDLQRRQLFLDLHAQGRSKRAAAREAVTRYPGVTAETLLRQMRALGDAGLPASPDEFENLDR